MFTGGSGREAGAGIVIGAVGVMTLASLCRLMWLTSASMAW